MHRRLLLSLFLSFAACGDASDGPTVVPGHPGTPRAPEPVSSASIDPPSLPECLTGKEPIGCAQPPGLPACLDTPGGCASPPQLDDWECPPGWGAMVVGEETSWQHTTCNVDEPPACPSGEAAFLGQTQCAPIGTACPAASFLDDVDIRALAPSFDGTILFVLPGASGVGTRSSPFGSMQEAIAASKPGDIIALGRGTLDEAVSVPTGVALAGTCVEESVLAPSSADEGSAILDVEASGALITNLTVTGPRRGIWIHGAADGTRIANVEVRSTVVSGLHQESEGANAISNLVVRGTATSPTTLDSRFGVVVTAGSLDIDHVLLERCTESGMLASEAGTTLTARHAIVRDTRAVEGASPFGRGIRVAFGATASLEQALLVRNTDMGLMAVGTGTTVEGSDIAIEGMEPLADGRRGIGLAAGLGAHVSLSRVSIEASYESAILAQHDQTQVALSQFLVRGTRGSPEGAYGQGCFAADGSSVTFRRGALLENRSQGIAATGDGTRLQVEDVVVAGTKPDASTHEGRGIVVLDGAAASLARVHVSENHLMGVAVSGPGELVAEDLFIDGTIAQRLEGQWVGIGLHAQSGARVTLSRVVVTSGTAAGVYALGGATEIEGEDVVIRDTQEDPDLGDLGEGLLAADGASVTLRRAAIEDNHHVGVLAIDAGRVSLEDARIRRTQPRSSDGAHGSGAWAALGAALDLSRVEVAESYDKAILVSQPGSTLVARDLTVRDTRPRASDGHTGQALQANGGATARLIRAVFEGQRDAAIVLGERGTHLDAEELLIRASESREYDRRGGRALGLMDGATCDVRKAVFAGNREVSVVAFHEGTVAKLEDVVVRSTATSACVDPPEPTCIFEGVSHGGGVGVSAVDGSRVELLRFETLDNAMAGLQCGRGGIVEASHGLVSGNPIGAHAQDEDFDLQNIVNATVRYVGNGTNLDSEHRPLPEVDSALEFIADD